MHYQLLKLNGNGDKYKGVSLNHYNNNNGISKI